MTLEKKIITNSENGIFGIEQPKPYLAALLLVTCPTLLLTLLL
jgi:hypothetical protein